MSARNWIALVLLGVQCTAMGVMTTSIPYPLLLFTLAALAPIATKRVPLPPRTIAALSVFMAVILLAYSQRASEAYSYTVWFPTYAMAVAFGRFFLFLEVLVIVRGFQLNPTPTSVALLPFLGILVMTCIGNVSSLDDAGVRFRALSLLFAACIAGYFASSLRHSAQGKTRAHVLRWALNLGFVGIAIAVAAATGAAVQQYGNELDRLLGIAAGGSSLSTTGFSGRARLDSVTRMRGAGGSKTALRIEAGDPPGYMRGIAYDTYVPPEWRVTSEVDVRNPVERPPASLREINAAGHWYRIREGTENGWKRQLVWRAAPLEGVLFAPLDTSWIGISTGEIAVDEQGIARASSAPTEYANAVSGQPDRGPLTEEMRGVLTRLPDDLDPRIAALARELTQGKESDSEKIAAVLGYFQGYEYSTDIRIPAADDPLVYFLLEKPPAHCEFFAAGATVLLRAAGVPARYVTGFMVTERNSFGGYWCARNRDAHAWAEAYDSAHGWSTVDATPPSGRPTGEAASRMADLWDGARFYAARLAAGVSNTVQMLIAGFPGFVNAVVGHILTTVWGLVLVAACVGGGLVYFRLRWARKRRARERDGFEEYHRLLDVMDRGMARAGFRRGPSETLERFCLRVLASPLPNAARIVEWYRAYMKARYGRNPSGETLENLRSMVHTPHEH